MAHERSMQLAIAELEKCTPKDPDAFRKSAARNRH